MGREVMEQAGQRTDDQPERCELCDRPKKLTKHHLVPRAVHRKKRYVSRFGKKEMRQRGLMLCKDCHVGIHDLIPNEKELADNYHSKELLLASEAVRKHVAWVRKQK
jgi:hypothetical protein